MVVCVPIFCLFPKLPILKGYGVYCTISVLTVFMQLSSCMTQFTCNERTQARVPSKSQGCLCMGQDKMDLSHPESWIVLLTYQQRWDNPHLGGLGGNGEDEYNKIQDSFDKMLSLPQLISFFQCLKSQDTICQIFFYGSDLWEISG